MSAVVEFWSNLHPLIQGLIKGLAVIGVMFPIGGACSLVERKVSAWIQGRQGPNRALPPWLAWVPGIGVLQRIGVFHLVADGIKMFLKEDPLPGHVNKFYFLLAPVVGMIPALTTVTVVPFGAYFDEAGRMIPIVLANLDVRHQVDLLEMVAKLAHRDGLGVLMAIHDLDLAAHYCDRLILLHEGLILADDTPEAVLTPEHLSSAFNVQARTFRDPFTDALRLSLMGGDLQHAAASAMRTNGHNSASR